MRRASLAAMASVLLWAGGTLFGAERVVVGSKNFEESRLLGEIFARLIEERTGLRVERRLGLAGTQVCFEALRSGAIDLYPEYTGTGLVTILGEPPLERPADTLERVRKEFLERYDLWWVSPLGFANSWALAVPKELAERYGLRTIGDLARVSRRLVAGFGYEFVEREDGLRGLRRSYGLEFAKVVSMQQALKYQAIASRRLDCIDAYTTDGRLLVHDLVVLEDDRKFFPPYDAAPLVRGETARRHPEVVAALGLLAGAFDEARMRALNLRVQEQGEPIERVAQDALERLGLAGRRDVRAVSSRGRSLLGYLWSNRRELARRTGEHLGLSGAALACGIGVAVPIGLWLERRRRWAETVIRAVGLAQTVPSIALLAFMIPLLGVGPVPALVALWIYSLFPILRNTYTGVREAPEAVVSSAKALGMTDRELLLQVRLPLATPVILAGVRTAGVLTVGTATLAAFIGAGGLGVPIVSGLQLADTTMILSGALPAAALALLVDGVLAAVERAVRPRGLGPRGRTGAS
jgi:osmoprotectant transport system permease protein